MKIAKVVGVTICTVKDPRLGACRMLLVSDANHNGEVIGEPYIAEDKVGAGPEELVVVVQGSSARVASGDVNKPVDAAIVGILDSLQFEGKTTFKKS